MPTLPDLSNIPRRQVFIVGTFFAAIILGVLLWFGLRPPAIDPNTQGDLTMWGVLDANQMKSFIDEVQRSLPGIKVQYREVDKESYDATLVDALAAGEGPDIFMVSDRDLPRQIGKIQPLLPEQFGIPRLREFFPAVVEEQFADKDGKIYGLPLYLDTLLLLYNKELFDQAGIVGPPKTWSAFEKIVPSLRSVGQNGNILQSAAAIGGTKESIATAVDLLNLLMIQGGAPMTSLDRRRALFSNMTSEGGSGQAAFDFYTKFGTTASPVYTWNDAQGDSIESFTAGKTAMIFDYWERIFEIQKKAPFLKMRAASMPQLSSTQSINYPHYWALTVSRQSRKQIPAWNFIIKATTDSTLAYNFFKVSKLPPALNSIIASVPASSEYYVPVRQALTARSWYEVSGREIDNIFSRAISRAVTGQATQSKALKEAEDQISELMRTRRQ
ncbi:MAG: extracellular solute-binding protein [Patescibacteria group bacterium]